MGLDISGKDMSIRRKYRSMARRRRSMPPVAKAREWLKTQGAEIVEVSIPHTKYALAAYYMSRRRGLINLAR